MEIVLIRHTAVDVPKGLCYGQSDVALAKSFPIEAAKVAEKLKTYTFDAVYSSRLMRCRKLAAYCGFENPLIDDRLLEINFGEWEMQEWDHISDPRLAEWYEDYIHVAPTGGESFTDQYHRFEAFIEDLRSQTYDRVAIFTHGGILMQAMLMFGLATTDTIITHQPGYGEMLAIKI